MASSGGVAIRKALGGAGLALALGCAGAPPQPSASAVLGPLASAALQPSPPPAPAGPLWTSPARLDVVLVLDSSGSSRYPSGVDVDADGEIGAVVVPPAIPGLARRPCSDPDDSILAAELHAARQLLARLDSFRVRVGIVSFGAQAQLDQPLAGAPELATGALEALWARGASGGTNTAAGLQQAIEELARGADAALAERHQRILLLTDGYPSLPYGSPGFEDPEDVQAALYAAELARQRQIRIDVYGLGPAAIAYPRASTEIAALAGGDYVPVSRPGDIVALLAQTSFSAADWRAPAARSEPPQPPPEVPAPPSQRPYRLIPTEVLTPEQLPSDLR